MKRKENGELIVAEVVYLDGNPHGGPDTVSYLTRAGARRSARGEAEAGLRVEYRELPA